MPSYNSSNNSVLTASFPSPPPALSCLWNPSIHYLKPGKKKKILSTVSSVPDLGPMRSGVRTGCSCVPACELAQPAPPARPGCSALTPAWHPRSILGGAWHSLRPASLLWKDVSGRQDSLPRARERSAGNSEVFSAREDVYRATLSPSGLCQDV